MRWSLLVVLPATLMVSVVADGESRAKRSYYDYGYGYGADGDFWYAGRILGIILGISMLLLCCCIPCVCIAGIWFAGWFGLRQRRQRKAGTTPVTTATTQGQAQYVSASEPIHQQQQTTTSSKPVIVHPIRVDTSPRSPPRHYSDSNNVIYAAEDHFYTSTTPSGDRRPGPYRASRF